MKKLLLCFLFIAAAFIIHAQDKKPTKEETIKFLNTLCQAGVGITEPGYSRQVTNYYDLTYSFLKFKKKGKGCDDCRSWSQTIIYESIPWQEVLNISLGKSVDEIISVVDVEFSLRMSRKSVLIYDDNGSIGNEENYMTKYVNFFIPKSKFESCKKAILRLAEIAKEENKDPFAN